MLPTGRLTHPEVGWVDFDRIDGQVFDLVRAPVLGGVYVRDVCLGDRVLHVGHHQSL
eukprot:SAG25_NODE_1348_length_3237_cov_4.509892_4_plen_57_part_00